MNNPKKKYEKVIEYLKYQIQKLHRQNNKQKRIIKLLRSKRSNKEYNKCYICYDKKIKFISNTCGHGGICYDCKEILYKDDIDIFCPICKEEIEGFLKVYLQEID